MAILDFYYDEDLEQLSVDFTFSTDYYFKLELDYYQIELYSPDIISKDDLKSITKTFIIDVLTEYLKDNELPEKFPL
jgi:hypothetical protein